ncbi:MAG: KTSC domain-containing protein [Comamonadaceae bacterium]|nr:KTSC domain-containing protein [Comamonadaceae bacterium]
MASSTLAGYLYRPDGTLLVAFRSGALYAYAHVSPQLVAALAAALQRRLFQHAYQEGPRLASVE